MAGDTQSSSATVSAQDIQDVRAQMDRLMQEMHTLQQSLHQHQYAEPPHDASNHVEDDDPTALEAEATCLRA